MKEVKIEDIPILKGNYTPEKALDIALEGFADEYKARIYISKPEDYYSEEKIVIIWDKPHPKYGESLTTKYYHMNEDGVLEWGEGNPPIILSK